MPLSLPASPLKPADPKPPEALRWLVLWIVLTAIYLAVDLPLRALAGDPFPPNREALLGMAAIPALQVGAIRFVQWMRRSLEAPPP